MGCRMIELDPNKVYELASQGLNQGMIAQGLGVSRETFINRLRDNSTISTAYKNGRDSSIQIVEDALFQMAASGKNVVASIFYLKNAKPEQYKDKHEVEHSGSMTVNVTSFDTNERVINPDDG